MTQWYYMQDGQSVGPVAFDRLKQLAQAGILAHDSVVRKEDGDWVGATEVRGLLAGEAESVKHSNSIGSVPSGSSKKYVLLAVVIVFLLVVGGILAVTLKGGSEPIPAELTGFRDSLIKLRSDLKLGLSHKEYHEALKSQQFAADKAAAAVVPEEHREFYDLLSTAFNEYLAAQRCIQYMDNPKLLPEYSTVAAIEAKLAEVDEETELYEALANNAVAMGVGVSEETASKLRELRSAGFKISLEYQSEFSRVQGKWEEAIAAMEVKKQMHWGKASELIEQAIAQNREGT